MADRLSTGEVATDTASSYGWSDAQALRVKTFLVNHRSNIQNLTPASRNPRRLPSVPMILIPILAIFFLSEGEALVKQVIRLAATEGNYDFLQSSAADLHSMMEHYIRAKVNSRRIVVHLCHYSASHLTIPACHSFGASARNPRIHTHGELADQGDNHHHHWRPDSLSLACDGGAAWYLADDDGQCDRSAGSGTGVGNTPTPRNFHIDGGPRSADFREFIFPCRSLLRFALCCAALIVAPTCRPQ